MLTQFAIMNAVAKDKPLKLSDGAGLHLLVQPGGSKDIQNNNCYELDSLRGLMV
jgi:hypothetical protein